MKILKNLNKFLKLVTKQKKNMKIKFNFIIIIIDNT